MNRKSLQFAGAGVLVALIVGLFTNFIVEERLEDFESLVALQQSEQRALLVGIAETTARNGADTVTESVVRDCAIAERTRFDSLLGRLDSGLPRSELIELERLFAGCGSFYSERKSLMVARMQREFELYESYTEQLETITGDDFKEKAQVPEWEALVGYEVAQSEHFALLVQLQSQIIQTLLDGKTITSPELSEILAQVKEAQENLAFASTQAATLRSEVLSL